MIAVRKLATILVLAVFGLQFLSPLLAAASLSEKNLPACCRRNGLHGCTAGMTMQSVDTGLHGKHWSSPPACSSYPSSFVVSHHSDGGLAPRAAAYAAVLSHPAVHVQTESKWRLARERSRCKRGPPTSSLV